MEKMHGRWADGWMYGWKEGRKGGKREGQGREMGFLIHPFNKYLNIDCEPVTVLRAGRKRSSEQERQRLSFVEFTLWKDGWVGFRLSFS